MAQKPAPVSASDHLHIVGIGASAGGLAALERFLPHIPAKSGVAYVVVQHLDPTRESLLPEILDRLTAMPALSIDDGQRIEPDFVYVAPPNRDVNVHDGLFRLDEMAKPHYQQRPIDSFFRSLAGDCGDQAVGVILSGAGSDGTEGLRAIKGAAGLTIAQSPETAEFDSMPSSAIATGLVDFVLPPEEMAAHIIDYVKRLSTRVVLAEQTPSEDDIQARARVLTLLRQRSGHDFTHYKASSIRRRIERRMMVNRIDDLADYVRYAQHKPEELDALLRELLIGVTQFFRDPESFEALRSQALRPLIESKAPGERLRVWCVGCSTGEEAYSIGILFHEEMGALGRPLDLQIFATDLDANAIETARYGAYREGIAADVAPERLKRFFVTTDSGFRVTRELRDRFVFAVQNAVQDPPISRLDLVSCRNVLIYLGPALQERLLTTLHYALHPDGYLFLGTSEGLGRQNHLFRLVDNQVRLFQKQSFAEHPVRYLRPLSAAEPRPEQDRGVAREGETRELPAMPRSSSLREAAEQKLLKRYSPAATVVTAQGEILYVHERTGRYLELAAGEASLNVLQMARQGLRVPLGSAIRRAAAERQEVVEPHVQVQVNGEVATLDLIVTPFDGPTSAGDLLMVVFKEVGRRPLSHEGDPEVAEGAGGDGQSKVADLEQELRRTREYLEATVQDLEASNEELQSANEELQSANEELISSKEEMQSVNEELATVNDELESKIDELTRVNSDLRNLLTSVEIGIIFLDRELNVLRFNPAVTNIFKLTDRDVGRPFAHVMSSLDYDHLIEDTRDALDSLAPKEIEVRLEDRWYLMRIRPYRAIHDTLDGLILTFSEITGQKQVQQELRRLSRALEQSSSLVIIADAEGTIEYVNQRFLDVTHRDETEVLGSDIRRFIAPVSAAEANEALRLAVSEGQEWKGELQHSTKNGEAYWVEARISPMADDEGRVTHLVTIEDDITEHRRLEQALDARHAKKVASEGGQADVAVLLFDQDLHYVAREVSGLAGLGLSEVDLEGRPLVERFPGEGGSELIHSYRAALRGDNVYFERAADGRTYGVQVMPLRTGDGHITGGIVVIRRLLGGGTDG